MIDSTKLTARENEVLALMAQGFSYPQITERLHIRRSTLRYHVRSMRLRCHIPNDVTLPQYVRKA